jgi:uncharacterized OB-fold protein
MSSPVKHWRDTKKLNQNLSQKGKLLVWTKIFTAPSGFEYQAPYFAGIIELENGTKVPSQIIDCEESDLKIGLKVISVVRRSRKPQAADIIEYGIKFKPL